VGGGLEGAAGSGVGAIAEGGGAEEGVGRGAIRESGRGGCGGDGEGPAIEEALWGRKDQFVDVGDGVIPLAEV